jgi:hypothetical protein
MFDKNQTASGFETLRPGPKETLETALTRAEEIRY